MQYSASDPTTGYFAFTSLATGSYNLYVVSSDSNPYDTANLSPVSKYSFSTETPSWAGRMSLALALLLILLQ